MKKILVFSATLALIIIPTTLFAQQQQGGFISLTNIEGLFQSGALPDLNVFLNRLFVIGIGIAAILAVVQIVIGGFQYMTTDALQGKQSGRERITGAVLGLLLVLFTYILLYTINPGIVSFNLFSTAPAGTQQQIPTTNLGSNPQASCTVQSGSGTQSTFYQTMQQCQQQCTGVCNTITTSPYSQSEQQLFNNLQQTVCTRQQTFQNEGEQSETITETLIFPNSEQCAAQCPRPGVTTFCTSG